MRLTLLLVALVALVLLTACGGGPTHESAAAVSRPSPVATSAIALQVPPAATPPAEPPTPVPPPPPTGIVTINAVGDIMLARDLTTLMDENGSDYPYAGVRDLLGDADLTIANMEGTFTERGVEEKKQYTFRTPPKHAVGLSQAGIDLVSLGNNHTMDYGPVGLGDTLAALAAAGVRHAGAGVNDAEARKPASFNVQGVRISFLSYCGVTESTPAGASSPGVAYGTPDKVWQDVTAAKQDADVVIVAMHAGTEYVDAPNDLQVQLAHAAVDAGAGLVLGSHAHVMQGWQQYGAGVIVYGMGNFVFDLDRDDLATLGERPFQSAVFRIELTKAGVTSVTARPVYIDPDEDRPLPATAPQAQGIMDRLERLNAALR